MNKLILLLIAIPAVALGQPSISDVDGVATPGTSLQITGSGFGSKSPAPPIRWMNFDDGVAGQTIPYSTGNNPGDTGLHVEADQAGESGWAVMAVRYSSEHSDYYGDLCLWQSFRSPDQFPSGRRAIWGLYTVEPHDLNRIYYCGWRKIINIANADESGNAKVDGNFHGWNSVGGSPINPNIRLDLYTVQNSDGSETHRAHHYALTEYDNATHSYPIQAWNDTWIFDTWIRQQRYCYIGTPGGGNGRSFRYIQIPGETTRTAVELTGTFREHPDSYFDNFYVGNNFTRGRRNSAGEDIGGDVQCEIFWDDIYIDDTLARVEAGTSPSYAASTHNEIQIPLTWSSDGTIINISFNSGRYVDGQQIYFYVINSAGTASAGYGPFTVTLETLVPTKASPTNIQVSQ